MPILVHSVPMTAKKFTQKDVDVSKKYVNPDVYPGLYNESDIPAGLKFIERRLVKIADIISDDEDSLDDASLKLKSRHQTPEDTAAQSARAHGRGQEAERVWYQIRTFGYKLDKIPASVAVFANGKTYLINGKTRLQELQRHGFVNLIADVYECTSWEGYHEAKQLFNVREDPYSPHTMEDIILTCRRAIKMGWIKNTYDDIKKKVDKVAPGSFLPNEVNKIISRAMVSDSLSNSFSWTTKGAYKDLRQWGYVDNEKNNGIYYFVYSAEAPVKAIPAAAKYLQTELISKGKTVKELRVVIHTATLQGADPELSWKSKIDNFRTAWREYSQLIKDAFFTSNSEFKHVIKLYGAMPAVTGLAEEYPMDRLVMFHVGKLKNHTFSEIDTRKGLATSLYVEENDDETDDE